MRRGLKKSRRAHSCNFPTDDITGAQNYNCALNFFPYSKHEVFLTTKFVFFGRKLYDRKNFSDRLKFRKKQFPLSPASRCVKLISKCNISSYQDAAHDFLSSQLTTSRSVGVWTELFLLAVIRVNWCLQLVSVAYVCKLKCVACNPRGGDKLVAPAG